MEIIYFAIVREVLRNNYRSRNLIGPYHFLGINLRNSTSFTRPFSLGGTLGMKLQVQSSDNLRVKLLCDRPCADLFSENVRG